MFNYNCVLPFLLSFSPSHLFVYRYVLSFLLFIPVIVFPED